MAYRVPVVTDVDELVMDLLQLLPKYGHAWHSGVKHTMPWPKEFIMEGYILQLVMHNVQPGTLNSRVMASYL